MVAKDATTTAPSMKERAHALLDALPDEAIAEVATFIEFQQFRLGERENAGSRKTRFKPTPMGGLAQGVRITAEDIAEARREMWGTFAGTDE